MKKPELLSPAGNMQSLKAAIIGGCDAVYLSGTRYGARAFAGNFNDEELIESINLCHLYGVKVYVTANTLVYEHEINLFLDYIDFLVRNNVDAVIIQDIGMMDLLRKVYPSLELHASTQMHIHNLEGVKLAQSLGIQRVVLARETPIQLIETIKKNTNVELEVFVHGALCISYSGQCLMSSLIGNRSGNRGTCAQCCRQPYSLIKDEKKINTNDYLLSTKDLFTLNNIDKLIDIGVDSLKIEGRMKRPEYVYLVTSLYRKAIDDYIETGKININENDINKLKKLFNRGFTKGFLFNESNDNIVNSYRPNHQGVKIGKVIDYKNNYAYIKLTDKLNINDGIRFELDDIGMIVNKYDLKNNICKIRTKSKITKGSNVLKTTDYNDMCIINELIKKGKKVSIDMNFYAHIDEPIKLELTDYVHNIKIKSSYYVQKSISSPIDVESLKKQLNKLGDTVYKINNIYFDVDNNIFIPVKVINELRRSAIDKLNEARMYKKNYKKEKYQIKLKDYEFCRKKAILLNEYDEKYNGYDEIYTIKNSCCTKKLPRVIETLPNIKKRLLVGELGSVYKYKDIVTDFSLNVVNSYSVALLHSLGVDKVTLSYELNDIQIKNIIDSYHNRYHKHPNLEIIINGYEEVMVSKYRLPNNTLLKDRFNNNYKIIIRDNLMYIYNYKLRNLTTNYYDMGINWIRVNKELD